MQTPENEATQDVREILGSILDQNRSRWQKFIVSILRNDADAEDVVQDAVRRVLLRGRSFSSKDQVRMYLGRAIGNVAFERYKGMKRERRRQIAVDEQLLMKADGANPLDHLEDAERTAEKERTLSRMRHALKLIPSKQYEALRMTILESTGSSIRDAGMTHGIPYSTLRHRSRQGLRNLRLLMRNAQSGADRDARRLGKAKC